VFVHEPKAVRSAARDGDEAVESCRCDDGTKSRIYFQIAGIIPVIKGAFASWGSQATKFIFQVGNPIVRDSPQYHVSPCDRMLG
jgi:hypothetical protein